MFWWTSSPFAYLGFPSTSLLFHAVNDPRTDVFRTRCGAVVLMKCFMGCGVTRWRTSQKNPMTFKVWQKVERSAFMFVLMVLVSVFHPSTTSISWVCGAIKGIPVRFIERLHVLNRCSALYRWRNVWESISDLVPFLWILLPLKVWNAWTCLVSMEVRCTPFTFLKAPSFVLEVSFNRLYASKVTKHFHFLIIYTSALFSQCLK